MREYLIPAAKIKLIKGRLAIFRLPHLFTPVLLIVKRELVHGCRRCLANRGRCVQMRINDEQLVVIMLIGMLIAGRSRRIIGVVHTGTQIKIRLGRILVVKAEGMPNLLAQDEIFPRRGVVRCGAKVGVIHLHRALCDVEAAHPDLGYPQPSRASVLAITDLHAPQGRIALCRTDVVAGDNRCIQHR